MTAVSATCVAVVATSAGPRRDLDYWWHVLLGRALLAGDASSAAQWAVWPGDPAWRTAQPLAEVLLAAADHWWQPAAPATVRAVTSAVAMAALAFTCRPWAGEGGVVTASRWWAFGCGAAVVMGFSQERPAQVGLMLMPLVGALAGWWSTTTEASRPGWLLLCGATLTLGGVWTLSHQSWLLAWAVLAVAAALSPRRLTSRVAFLGVLTLVMAWGWLWVGPPWAAVSTAGAASSLAEWQPTQFATIPGIPATAMVVAFAAAIVYAWQAPKGVKWLRGDISVYLTLLVLGVAGASAWRHVPVTVLAAGPILIALVRAHADQAPGRRVGRHSYQRRSPAAPKWTAAIGLCVALSVLAVHAWAHLQSAPPTDADRVATIAARHTCSWQRPATIATHYNDSGPVLAGARAARCAHAEQMRVVIDGRADRYGSDALRRWQDVLNTQGERWEGDWRMVDADIALLPQGSPLSRELRRQGWSLAEARHGYIVLYHPLRHG